MIEYPTLTKIGHHLFATVGVNPAFAIKYFPDFNKYVLVSQQDRMNSYLHNILFRTQAEVCDAISVLYATNPEHYKREDDFWSSRSIMNKLDYWSQEVRYQESRRSFLPYLGLDIDKMLTDGYTSCRDHSIDIRYYE